MIWPAEDLWQALVAWQPGLTVEVLPQIDSTNTELMRRARAGQNDPVLLVAEAQTAGRGRLGRPWHGQAGEALTFSLGLPLMPRDWSGLSLAVGLCLAQSLDPEGALGVRLKWPNDLWVAQAQTSDGWGKLAGVLIETALTAHATPEQPRYCVVGVGINIAPPQEPGLSTTPLGLQQLWPEATAPSTLTQVALPLLKTLLAFEREGFAPLQALFNARDALHDRPVRLSDGRVGTARGVDLDGALRVDTAQGRERITSAEVSVRLQ
ncbi:biotin--[acetyl-CoA-carboxylase] ligase [Limnohabitans sp. JirII-31]|uniref:biotin--[acetyl-CoA-carboxylase] ligase n=1 Tax=Limnohabitans sp. JirII-31 TaxID=1977908 RepID=UPI000C1ED424|nr:biotin--[acetyl-CoA-carboxylase] ligase [Limnohabitans sp. JirII-31]PIT78347.1 biotin--[acetyl-CoA-carboxylase] ligase [Limnohabitans sp. JirII-31]